MNNFLDLAIEPLDHLEAPLSTGGWIAAFAAGFAAGVGIGVLIT